MLLGIAGWTSVLLVWGTLMQASPGGLAQARSQLFDAWLVWPSAGVPLPAMLATLALACIWLTARLAAGPGGWREGAGMRLVEAGLLALLLGRGLTGPTVDNARLILAQDSAAVSTANLPQGKSVALPFSLRLLSFEHSFHPGSSIPANYASRVEITEGDRTWEAVVSMNRPLRLRGYSFFQLSYTQAGPLITSTLGVVRRPLRHLPAAATGLVALGMLLQLLRRSPPRAALLVPLLLAGLPRTSAAAEPPPSPSAMAPVPILVEGRVMPLDTFARMQWRQITGRAAPADETALAWLTATWFDPASSSNRVMLVQSREVAEAIGLEWQGRRLRVSYAELAPVRDALRAAADSLRHQPPGQQGADGRETVRLAAALSALERLPLARLSGVVPVAHGGISTWKSLPVAVLPPWSACVDDPGVGTWRALAEAYAARDARAFDAAAARWMEFAIEAAQPRIRPARLRWEVRLNRLDPCRRAAVLTLLAFLAAVLAAVGVPWQGGRYLVWIPAGAAFALLSVGLVLRTFLLGRPPVTNLYATFLFAAWVVLAIGWTMARRNCAQPVFLAATPLAFVLLRAAGQLRSQGDDMGQLAAILDTNLWLGVHVTTIMVGFAACLLAAALSHVALLAACRKGGDRSMASVAAGLLPGVVGVGFAFTLLGMLLGGLWADVAWGRFWGWDPKENGALLVVLWFGVLWELARNSRMGERATAVAGWVGGWVVMAAWQGVNLLGIGRHSYGWSEDRTWLLAAFLLDALFLFFAFNATIFAKETKP